MEASCSGRRERCQPAVDRRREQNGSTRQPKPRGAQRTRGVGGHDLWAFNPRAGFWFFLRASRPPNDRGPEPRPSRWNCRIHATNSSRSNRRYLPSLMCGTVFVRVRSYSQLFRTRISAAASSIVSHPVVWFGTMGTLAARTGMDASRPPSVLEPECSGTRADCVPSSEQGEMGACFIPGIGAQREAVVEGVIFRPWHGRRAREGGIPQGIPERINERGSCDYGQTWISVMIACGLRKAQKAAALTAPGPLPAFGSCTPTWRDPKAHSGATARASRGFPNRRAALGDRGPELCLQDEPPRAEALTISGSTFDVLVRK